MTGAVLWDLDGTLVDSQEHHWRAWRDTIAAEGLSITRDQFLATFGLRNDSIVPQWLGPAADPARIQRVADAKESRYRRLIRQSGLTALPGAAGWLKHLHEQGWRQAVASSAPLLNIDAVLEVLGLAHYYFQVIVSAEDVKNGKPDPEVFLTAARRLEVPPSRSIVVEDAPAGIEAARRAGMRSIGVSRAGSSLPADLVVASLAALPRDAFATLLSR